MLYISYPTSWEARSVIAKACNRDLRNRIVEIERVGIRIAHTTQAAGHDGMRQAMAGDRDLIVVD